MASTSAEVRRQARGRFDAAEFGECLRIARQGLGEAPDDVELLVLAGRAGVEVDSEDAVDYLRRATELAPADADGWHYYGEALAADGRTSDADAAFRRAVELEPDDQVALTHLGHTALAAGRNDEGVGYLARAADIAHAPSTAAISLVDMYRSFGQFEDALDQGRRLAQAAGDDLLAWLDVAELSLQVGQLDEAKSAFEKLRDLDDVPGHEVYPLHGLLLVEIRRHQWDRAAELATQAATIDPRGLSTDVAAFVNEQISGPGDLPAPTAAEVEATLSASLAEYRRMHADDRRLYAGEPLG